MCIPDLHMKMENLFVLVCMRVSKHVLWPKCGNQRTTSGISSLLLHMGPQEQTWVLRLGSKSLYPLEDIPIPLNVKPTQGERCQIVNIS